MGPRRFLGLFFGDTAAGGLAWSAVHWRLGGMHIGAMAAVDALLVVFACCYPNRPLDFLLFFVIPVRFRPTNALLFLVGLSLICPVAYDIVDAARPFASFSLAPSAHLAGLLVCWVSFNFIR